MKTNLHGLYDDQFLKDAIKCFTSIISQLDNFDCMGWHDLDCSTGEEGSLNDWYTKTLNDVKGLLNRTEEVLKVVNTYPEKNEIGEEYNEWFKAKTWMVANGYSDYVSAFGMDKGWLKQHGYDDYGKED